MRLPLAPLAFSLATIYGSVWWAGGYRWAGAAVLAFLSLFVLAEWCVDAVVRELRRLRLR